MALKKIKFHINRHMLLVVPAAAMVVTLALLTGTAAQASRVTGAVPTTPATRAAAAAATRITVYVPWVLVPIPTVSSGVLRVSTPAAAVVAAIAPATVLATAAVPLRIPVIGCHCEP